jgi:flagellar basal body rod protein FlgG
MNYGLYLSASGVLTNLYRQDVFANNLANVETVGFKPDQPTIRQRDPESIEDGFGARFRKQMLDRLGGGAFAGTQTIDFSVGPLQRTGGDLDAALARRDEFFAVRVTEPGGRASVRLTRDGRFTLNGRGELVTVVGGHAVLDTADQPIRVTGPGRARLNARGELIQNGESVGRLQVTRVGDLDRLHKLGGNLFAWHGAADPRQASDTPDLRPGHLESSGVDPIKALMDLVAATKAASSNGNLIRYHDLMMDRAVNVLGRITA